MRLEDVQIRLIDSLDEAVAFKQWMSEDRGRSHLAVDSETTGLGKWGKDRLRLVQVGDANAAWVVPVEQWGWGGLVNEVLKAYDGRVLMHNAGFDMAFINRDEQLISWSQVDDTRTLAWLVDSTRPTGLKALSDRYVDPRASRMQSTLDTAMAEQKWTWATVPVSFKPFWVYSGLDCILTARIWEHLTSLPTVTKETWSAYELELSVLPVFHAIEQKGMRVDPVYAAERRTEFVERATQWKTWAEQEHGIVLTSNQQFVRRVQALGVELTKKTEGGALSCDKEVIADLLLDENEAVRHLAFARKECQQLIKLTGSYLDKIVNVGPDQRIHASINPLGARTSRVSVTGELAMQTMPRSNDGNPSAIDVRNCFIPSEDCALVSADWSQVELRVAAHFANDQQMIDILTDPSTDPFCEFAKRIYSLPEVLKSDPRRQITKNATYATLYGAGPEKFALTAGITPAAGQEFMDNFYRTFPNLKRLQNQIIRVASQRLKDEGDAYIRTPSGHRLVAPPNKLYKLLNYLVQGTSANFMKSTLVAADNAGLTPHILMTIHDEFLLDAPKTEINDVMKTIKDVMESDHQFRIPIRADVVGPLERWGAK